MGTLSAFEGSELRDAARPNIAISIGDPGGIGPEVLVRALSDPDVCEAARWVLFGSNEVMLRAAAACDLQPMWWRVPAGSRLEEATAAQRIILVDMPESAAPVGIPSAAGGAASYRWVDAAIASTKTDSAWKCDAIVTAPISKHAWSLAGRRSFAGHTEMLRDRFHAKRVVMAFESPAMRVVLATAHIPLMELREALTIGRVFDAIDLGARFCAELGIRKPRLGVCGLNPHAGEEGMLGDEDERLIRPAIVAAREQGIAVDGPFPADTIFRRARLDLGPRPDFDLIVAMYHDQGLIPVKTLAFEDAVNVTVGLEVPRTSPDHGTAFDIAGRGLADCRSMKAAMLLAAKLCRKAAHP